MGDGMAVVPECLHRCEKSSTVIQEVIGHALGPCACGCHYVCKLHILMEIRWSRGKCSLSIVVEYRWALYSASVHYSAFKKTLTSHIALTPVHRKIRGQASLRISFSIVQRVL